MSFQPDILVERQDSHDLVMVVEAKIQDDVPRDLEGRLLDYMRGRGCDFAVLVTSHTITVFRDPTWPDALEKTGPLPLGDLFEPLSPLTGAEAGFAFENRVQDWIEEFASGRFDARVPPATQDALRRELLPYLGSVEVRAAHPRYLRSA